MFLVRKKMVVEGLAGSVRDQTRYQNTIKMISKSVPEPRKSLYKFHDRERCTEMMPTKTKLRPEVIPKSKENLKDGGSERGWKYVKK